MKKSIKNFITIFFLGISSGLPIALILSTLKALLLDRGFDIKTIGFFSLVALPYSLKIFFAPFIDSCAIPFLSKKFGRRKSWIILTQLLLVIFIAALGVAGIFANLTTIAIFATLLAVASASQDIVIDAYRIELIKKENQAAAAGYYIYGYRVGMLISGAGALALAEVFSFDVVYLLMSLFMFVPMILTSFAEEKKYEKSLETKNFTLWFKSFAIAPILDLSRHERWYLILIFVILFKLSDAFAGNLTLPFLLELGFSKIEVAKVLKTFGLFATLFGVFIGGLLSRKMNIVKTLFFAGIAQMLSNLAFSYLAKVGNDMNIFYLVVFVENFCGGIGDAVFVAYLSGLCSMNFSATQYALLTSLATTARSLLVSSAGVFAMQLGWYQFFIFSTFLALPGLLLLFFIGKKS